MARVAVLVAVVVLVVSALVKDPLGLLYDTPPDTTPPDATPSPPPPQVQDVGEPLFLTPLLEAGKMEEARRLSQVSLGEEYALSYAGFFTVNKTVDSNHFVWFFPAREGWEEAPIMVWLDGGPGLSSLFSLFFMHGPFTLNADLGLLPREHTCVKTLNVIYIDNPVCAGFSYTGHIDGIPRDQVHVGSDLYSSLTQLLSMFPEIKDNNLFVAGHSYGGKFVPALGHTIHWRNHDAQHKIQLKGIAIGSGVVDPASLINYGDMLYVLGLVDEKERRYFKAQTELALSLVRRGDLIMAQKVVGSLMGLDISMSYYERLVGQKNTNNFAVDEGFSGEISYMEGYVSQPHVRRSLHVGNKTFHPVYILGKYFTADVMRSTKPWVEEMLNNSIKVMMYNGQLELSVPYPSHEMLARTLHWGHGEEYLDAPRQAWQVEGQLAGYVREARGLVRVLVRCAGHGVGVQQPHWMFDMFTRFMTRDTFL